ncbi:MAG: aspartate--tRNA(Asn) ligase [Candidatus Aenigmatarchaeota archaeon]
MERTYVCDAKPGNITVSGWADQIRDIGNLKFFRVRDRTGSIQVTLKKGETDQRLFKIVDNIHREDCVIVSGKAVASKIAQEGVELFPEKIEIVSKAETPLPLETREQIKTNQDKRLDYRFMDIRNPKIMSVFKIKSEIVSAIREIFVSEGFIEVTTPVLQAAGAEGGATMFPVEYYGQKAFLRQSPQLYKQMLMASGLDRVWEIGPAFRAEKFHTRRHVSEFMSVDAEMSWIKDEEDVMGFLERLTLHVLKNVKKNCGSDLKILEKGIKIPETPFKRLTYDEMIDALKKQGVEIEYGTDTEDSQEKILGEYMAKKGHEWFFVKSYPAKLKPFYIMQRGEVTGGMDFFNNGMELASGGQREHRYDQLVKVMKQKELDPKSFGFYLDAFRYGIPPHGGFGLGGERLVQQITGVENIREAIMFPRTPDRLVP